MGHGPHNEGRAISAKCGRDIRRDNYGALDFVLFDLLGPKLNILNAPWCAFDRIVKEPKKDKLGARVDYDGNKFGMPQLREKYLKIIEYCEKEEKNRLSSFLKK